VERRTCDERHERELPCGALQAPRHVAARAALALTMLFADDCIRGVPCPNGL
jgi:hypothetical protein